MAAGVAFCVVFGSIFWRAANEPAVQTTYRQCGAISDDRQRLACFDAVFHRNSALDVGRMTFAEILMGLRSNTNLSGATP
jgi:hypothetical protein